MVMSKSPYVRFHPTSACTGPTWIVKRNVIGKYMHRDNLIREDGKRKLESDRPSVPRGYTRATPLSRAAASLFIMIYTFYIFNRKGDCVYYEEWNRKRPPANLAQEQKLMFGLLYVFFFFFCKEFVHFRLSSLLPRTYAVYCRINNSRYSLKSFCSKISPKPYECSHRLTIEIYKIFLPP